MGSMMKRIASGLLVPINEPGKRIASAVGQFEMDPGKLYFTTRAMHWEQMDRKGQYKGNDNGDFWEGGANVVWRCTNKKCSNKDEHKRFLKYAGVKHCPHCNSPEIEDWEAGVFGKVGELLTKTDDGKYRWETWRGQPLNINHDEKRVIGSVRDVWPVPPEKGIDELLEVDAEKDKFLTDRIARGAVTGTSLEVLVGASICSCCFHIATDETAPKEKGGWCEHLRMYKGRFDPKTGQRVFEINKNLIGSGHAIIATGEPADQGARIYTVFAQKTEEPSPNFNHTEMNSKKKATLKPIVSDNNLPEKDRTPPRISRAVEEIVAQNQGANRRSVQNSSRLGQRSDDPKLPAAVVTVPDLKDMGAQLKAYGNYMSSRSKEEVAMAGLPPELRKKLALLDNLTPQQQASLGLAPTTPLVVDKEFVAAHVKQAVATKKIAAKDAVAVLTTMVGTDGERLQFQETLRERSSSRTNGLRRLEVRKAQLTDHESVRDVIIDVVADALQDAGDQLKQTITEETLSGVIEGADQLTENNQDFTSYLTEDDSTNPGEIADLHAEEPCEKEAVMTKEIPLDEVEVEATNKETIAMNKSAQTVEPHVTDKKDTPTQEFPKSEYLDGNGIDKNAKPVDVPPYSERKTPGEVFPAQGNKVMAALLERKAELENEMGFVEGEGFIRVSQELKKVLAQIRIQTEEYPAAKDLDGNGLSKNPQPLDIPAAPATRSTPSTLTPGSEQKTDDVSDHGEGIVHVAQSNFVDTGKVEVAKPEETRDTKTSEYPKSEEQKRKDPPERKTDKEIHPGNKDNALETEKSTKETDVNKTDIEMKNQGVQTPIVTPEEAAKRKNQGVNPSQPVSPEEAAKLKGQGVDPSKAAAPDEDAKLKGQGVNPTKAANPDEDAKLKGQGVDPTKSKNDYDDARSLSSNPDSISYPKEMLRSGKLDAKFVPNSEPGKRSASYWEVLFNDKPFCRITAKAAFKDEVIKQFNTFQSEEYGRSLCAALQEHGFDGIQEAIYEKGDLTLVTAQSITEGMPVATPTQQQVPINVAPEVSDKILNESKPGLSVGDLLVNLLAPIVVESDSMSVSSVMKDLVELSANQDKVTEVTTKLNDAVQNIRSKAGLPQESAPPAPAAGVAPEGPAPIPGAQQGYAQPTAPGPQQINTVPMTAQASKKEAELEAQVRKLQAEKSVLLRGERIANVCKRAQESGLIDNYNSFIRAGMSRNNAKKAAANALQKKVHELVAMNSEVCEASLNELLSATKRIASLKNDPSARRAASFENMKREAGGTMLQNIPGSMTDADEVSRGKKTLALSWKVANDIDPKKIDEMSRTVPTQRLD